MDILSLIPRRLDQDSCVTVGTQIEAEVKDWKNDHKQTSLPPTLESKVNTLLESSRELDTLDQESTQIGEIDRIVDSCLAAWNNLPPLLQKLLQGEERLPHSEKEKTYLEALGKIQALSLPEGVEIIRLPFRRQWRAMQKVKRALHSLETELATTGLSLFANRIFRWIDLYGAKLGITEVSEEFTDQNILRLERWHKHLAEVFFTVLQYEMNPAHSDLQNLSEKAKNELRNLFNLPYETQAEVERREVREARERRRKKNEEQNLSPTQTV